MANDTRLFFVESSDKGHRYFEERATERMGREQTIQDIVNGNFGNIVRVLMVEGDRALDCTSEILREAAELICDQVDSFMSSSERQEYYDRANKLMEVA